MKKHIHNFGIILMMMSLIALQGLSQECDGNQQAFITNTISGDTGELRYKFPSAIPAGTMSVTINKGVSVNDAFVNLSGTSTSRSNAAIDIRIDDVGTDSDIEGFSFTQSGDSQNATANFPPFTNDTDHDVEISWDATGSNTMITVTIDGQLVAGPFPSEAGDQSAVAAGVEILQYRFGFQSDVETNGAGLFVDDIVVTDPNGTVLFSDDFDSYTWGESLDSSDNATSIYNDNTTDASVSCNGTGNGNEGGEGGEGGDGNEGSDGSEFCGNNFAFITDLKDSDTGELRYSLDSLIAGTVTATINKDAGKDGFVNISGTSTSRANAIIDIRVKDGSYEFTQSGESQNATANFPPYTAGTDAEFEISWDASSGTPMVTVTIDGQLVAGPFASEGADAAAIIDGVRTVQFRYSDNSFVETSGAGMSIDDIVITDASGAVVFSEDFEGFTVGDGLNPGENANSTFHGNTSDASVNCDEGDLECNSVAFITDLNDDDTGELRYSLDSLIAGTVTATINKDAGKDGFVNISGTSTSRANAIIDIRVKDGSYEFTQSGESQNATANFPPYTAGTDAEFEISWDASSGTPMVTVTIDGQLVAGPFASEGADAAAIIDGVRTVQFRYADNSFLETTGAGMTVDDIVITDAAGTVIFSDDFESYDHEAGLNPGLTADSPYHGNTSDVSIIKTCVEVCNADFSAFITDLNGSDTGELRYSLDSIDAGTITATINKMPGKDGFVNISGTSTSRANAIIDIRVSDSGYSFTEAGSAINATANFPTFTPNTDAEIEISWDATAGTPMVTVTIDGQLVAGPFASGGADAAAIADGLRTLQFRFADNSHLETGGAGMFVDNIVISDASGTILFSDDFESYAQGTSLVLGLNAESVYHGNSSDVTVECDGTIIEEMDPCDEFIPEFAIVESATEFCEGESATLEVTGNYDSVMWSTGETTSSITVTAGGDYTATAMFECVDDGIGQSLVFSTTQFDNEVLTELATICEGDVYMFNGEAISVAGDYVSTGMTVQGCSSMTTLTLSVIPTVITSESATICAGESVTINDEEFSDEGIFVQEILNSAGCVDLVNVTITVNDVSVSDISESICSGESVTVNGEEYSEAGTFVQEITNADGCTDVVNVTITVNDVSVSDISESICSGESVTVNGEEFSEAGTFVQEITNTNGCTDVVNVTITVNDVSVSDISESICSGESVSINGDVFSEAGTFVQEITNTNGCTDVVNVTITINDVSVSDISESICSGESVTINGEVFSEAGTFVQEITNTNGCTDVVNVSINVNESASTSIIESICAEESYIFNGQELSDEGIYTANLMTSEGCDSLITLTLSVIPSVTETVEAQICDNGSTEVNGVTYTGPGSFEQMVANSTTGCTELLIVNVSITDIITNEITEAICPGDTFTFDGTVITEAGESTFDYTSVTGCDSIVVLTIEELAISTSTNSYEVVEGETIIVEGQEISEDTTFDVTLTNSLGCDSIVTSIVTVIEPVIGFGAVYYGFDECSLLEEGYSEFAPIFPEALECADDISSSVYRVNAATNGHSCTEGLDGTTTMCITSYDQCRADWNSIRKLIFETDFTITDGGSVSLEAASFSHVAPTTFAFTNGGSGDNNYPTLMGYRVILDGVVIAEMTDVPTSQEWAEMRIDLSSISLTRSGSLVIEILPYCPVGVDSSISAWDIENLSLDASCGEDSGRMQMYGLVNDRNNASMSNVQMVINEFGSNLSVTTDENGAFAYSTDADLALMSPQLDKDHLNGVSTLDILLIQQHILNIRPFDDQMNYIAADVDNSNSVTAKDLVDIRKLILGKTDAFPNNTSWRFDHSGSISSHNFDISEQYSCSEDGSHNVNFTGIKIGDVNRSNIETRNDLAVNVRYHVENNQISVYLDENVDMMGLQFALELDSGIIESISSTLESFSDANYEVSNGLLMVSWNTQTSMTIETNVPVMVINYSGIDHVSLTTAADHLTEVYDHELNTMDVNLINTNATTTTQSTLVAVSPNPVTNNVTISLEAKGYDRSDITLQLVDLEGKTVLNDRDINLDSTIDLGQLHSGIYILRVTYGEITQYEKIIKL